MNRTLSLALVAAIAAASGAGAVFAQDTTQTQQRVPAGDLNLRSAAGRATLNRRVRDAADTVCDTDGGTKDLAATMDADRCRRAAMRSGDAQAATLAARQEASAHAEQAAAARRAVARVEAKRRIVRHRATRHHHLHHQHVTHTTPPAPPA